MKNDIQIRIRAMELAMEALRSQLATRDELGKSIPEWLVTTASSIEAFIRGDN